MANKIATRQDVEAQIIVRALKDETFKQQLLNNPDVAKTEVEKLLGQQAVAGFKVQVLQETEDTAYIVLPYAPSTEGLTDEQLESVASGTIWFDGNFSLPCTMGSATFQNGINIGGGYK